VFGGIIQGFYGSNLLREIIDHPFNVELMNNTLNIESFKFYIQQDRLFLDGYIRTVLLVASKMENCENLVELIKVAQGAIAIRSVLYNHYSNIYNINYGEKSLECFNFTNFLLSISYSNVREAITVLYSYHFIYKIVIDMMKRGFKRNNRYKDWLDFYSSDLIESGCIILENMVDEYCTKVGESEKKRMLELFKITARLELDFWDSVYYRFSKFNTKDHVHQDNS
jgi:thiaminase/transcriptional activator TenA